MAKLKIALQAIFEQSFWGNLGLKSDSIAQFDEMKLNETMIYVY